MGERRKECPSCREMRMVIAAIVLENDGEIQIDWRAIERVSLDHHVMVQIQDHDGIRIRVVRGDGEG